MKLSRNPHGVHTSVQKPCRIGQETHHDGCQCRMESLWSAAVRATLEDVARDLEVIIADDTRAGCNDTATDRTRYLAARYRAAMEEIK